MDHKPKIWLSSPHMGGTELKYIHQAFNTNWISPLGPNVDAFEKSLADYCDTRHCAALSSGTSAIHLALSMLGVGPGDYVICQSFTFAASANPIKYLGATPVFVDSERDTWNMDPELLEKAILEINSSKVKEEPTPSLPPERDKLSREGSIGEMAQGRKGAKAQREEGAIKAIIPVHLYGMPAKMDEILAISRKYDIPVIEDAAEALGSIYYYRPAGSMGLMGIISFNGNKIITTSGGGALLSDDQDLIEEARFLASQAKDNAPHYQHSKIGYNYRMSNIIAGIGLGQMEVLNERIERRREINSFYRERLADIPGITFQDEPSAGFISNYWLTSILIDPKRNGGITREDIRLSMNAENIESRPLWKPLHLQPVFKNEPAFVNGISEELFENGLCLPSGSNLTENELERVVTAFQRTITKGKQKLVHGAFRAA
jgi:dTDP-4-amino-4,6-dideoxygalactose transaminase